MDYANRRAGERVNLSSGISYRAGRHLFVEPSVIFEEMDVDEGWLYEARISQLTTAWQFNARSFLRAILQHVDYQYHSELYLDARGQEYEHLFTQLLFSYKLNPQTVFFLGYSDNSVGTQDYSLTRADRTVFVKLGYAWVR